MKPPVWNLFMILFSFHFGSRGFDKSAIELRVDREKSGREGRKMNQYEDSY